MKEAIPQIQYRVLLKAIRFHQRQYYGYGKWPFQNHYRAVFPKYLKCVGADEEECAVFIYLCKSIRESIFVSET